MLAASGTRLLMSSILESVRMRLKKCSRSHTPNATTLKAMQDAEKRENLIKFNSIDDLFKSLEK